MVDTDEVIAFIRRHWPKKRGLAAAVLLVVALLVPLFARVDLDVISGGEWLILALLVAAVVLVWLRSNAIPRHPKRTVGFDLVLGQETEEHGRKLQQDLVHTLRTLLAKGQARHPFHFTLHPAHRYERLTDRSAVNAFMAKTRGHFLIWGRARERTVGGASQHVLELDGWVAHRQVEKPVKDRLTQEFVEVFPRRLMVAKENDLFTLQVTADWLDVSARYVVALAALISGDLEYAKQLLEGLESRLAGQGDLPPPLAKVKNRVPSRLADILKLRLGQLIDEYRLKRDEAALEQSVPLLDRLEEYEPNYYSGLLQRAICLFVLERDIDGAVEVLEKCASVKDPTWRYSRAFLLAYAGDLDGAAEELRQAVRRDLDDQTVPIQSEEFIHGVLEKEPDKSQLYFLLGVINYKAKEDLASARRDLERFVGLTEPETYPKQRELAQKWIGEIDRELGRRAPE